MPASALALCLALSEASHDWWVGWQRERRLALGFMARFSIHVSDILRARCHLVIQVSHSLSLGAATAHTAARWQAIWLEVVFIGHPTRPCSARSPPADPVDRRFERATAAGTGGVAESQCVQAALPEPRTKCSRAFRPWLVLAPCLHVLTPGCQHLHQGASKRLNGSSGDFGTTWGPRAHKWEMAHGDGAAPSDWTAKRKHQRMGDKLGSGSAAPLPTTRSRPRQDAAAPVPTSSRRGSSDATAPPPCRPWPFSATRSPSTASSAGPPAAAGHLRHSSRAAASHAPASPPLFGSAFSSCE